MINLIPPQAKRFVLYEYVARTAVIAGVATIFLLMIAASLAVPQLVLLRAQHAAITEQYNSSQSEGEEVAALTAEVEAANQLIAHVQSASTYQPLVPFVNAILMYESAAVSITRVSVVRDDEGSVSAVQVVGRAATREDLATFKEALEADSLVDSVDLPIANLAKDRDVPFNIAVSIAVPE